MIRFVDLRNLARNVSFRGCLFCALGRFDVILPGALSLWLLAAGADDGAWLWWPWRVEKAANQTYEGIVRQVRLSRILANVTVMVADGRRGESSIFHQPTNRASAAVTVVVFGNDDVT